MKKLIIFVIIVTIIVASILIISRLTNDNNKMLPADGTLDPEYYVEDETTPYHTNIIENMTFNIPSDFSKVEDNGEKASTEEEANPETDTSSSSSNDQTGHYNNGQDFIEIERVSGTNIYMRNDIYEAEEVTLNGLFGLYYQNDNQCGFIFTDAKDVYFVSANTPELLESVMSTVKGHAYQQPTT